MKQKFFTRSLLILIATVVLYACATPQAATPLPPLRVEFTNWWGDYTLLVAKEKGFFEKYGVEVEPVYYEVFSDTFPDLAAGQIDAGLIAVGDTINITRIAPMKVVAVYDNGGVDAMVARPEITSVEDLKGATVGTQIGSQYELMVTEMLRSADMDTSDINMVTIYPEDGLAALESNQAQVVYIWEPYLSEAISKGYRVIYPSEQLHLFPDLIVFHKAVVDQRPNDVRAFLKAWFEAVEYRLQNPEETRAIAAKYLGVTVNEVQPDDNLKILTLEDNRAIFDLQDANSIYSITKTTSDYLISIGTITQMIDPLELLDPEFLP